MARSTYYYHIKSIKQPDKYEGIKKEIIDIYNINNGRYGYRRITLELKKRGFTINHKTVSKLMLMSGIKCRVRMKKFRSYKGEVGMIAPNLLQRDFNATVPGQKWVTDVTEFSLFGDKIYLSPILDLFNSEIISYTIFNRPNLEMVTSMLNHAFIKIPNNTELILHSDQGWHYQNKKYRQMLKEKGVTQSMSRKGNCLDNAVIENFFGILKSELLYLRKFESMKQFKLELNNYIQYYNNKRIKIKLNGLCPVEFRTQSIT